MQLCTTAIGHHHTVQVARVQVQYLSQWMWLNEKQLVTTTTFCVAPVTFLWQRCQGL